MSKPSYILLAGLVGAVVGMYSGIQLEIHYPSPTSVHVRDLDEDGRPDVLVRNRRGDDLVYLQQEDGSYKLLERVEERLQQQFRSTIEDKVKNIR